MDPAVVTLPDHRNKHAPNENPIFLIPKMLPVGKGGWLLEEGTERHGVSCSERLEGNGEQGRDVFSPSWLQAALLSPQLVL